MYNIFAASSFFKFAFRAVIGGIWEKIVRRFGAVAWGFYVEIAVADPAFHERACQVLGAQDFLVGGHWLPPCFLTMIKVRLVPKPSILFFIKTDGSSMFSCN